MFNRFNPYMFNMPNYNNFIPNMMTTPNKGGFLNLLSGLGRNSSGTAGLGLAKKGINWSTILTNTQKTLGVINQTIPTINQIKPIVNNAKTMFRLMNEMKKSDFTEVKAPVQDMNINKTQSNTTPNNNGLKFFL